MGGSQNTFGCFCEGRLRVITGEASAPPSEFKSPLIKGFFISKIPFYCLLMGGGFGAALYSGSTAGMSAESCSIRVSPEGWVDKNSGELLSFVALIIFCQTVIAPIGL